jgi:3-phosphoshikimate 1-carboxyvinyltransferase
MLASLAEGVSEIYGFLEGEDCLATLRAFSQMGVKTERSGSDVRITGNGLHGLKCPPGVIDLGNSGTSMRLLSGILAGQGFDTVLTGDDSLRRRPMRRVTEPLARMGARIATTAQGTAPLRITGGSPLTGIDFNSTVSSAQVKSCVLLAGLYASGRTRVTEPAPSRDHTERMLAAFGCPVERDGLSASVTGGAMLQATRVDVPGDISSAAFFMVGACLQPGRELVLENVGVNPTRTGVIEILRLMGARIEFESVREVGGEPVADLRIHGTRLRGIEVPTRLVPLAIDEFPALFVAAACAEGVTVVRGAEELRVKESDRIQVMADGLRGLGIDAEALPDGMRISGGRFRAGSVASQGDHRVAMSFAMAGLCADGPIQISDCDNVGTSFPGFRELAARAGLQIQASNSPA